MNGVVAPAVEQVDQTASTRARLYCAECGQDALLSTDRESLEAVSRTGAVVQRRKYRCGNCNAGPFEFWLVCVGRARSPWFRRHNRTASHVESVSVETTVRENALERRTSIVLSLASQGDGV